MQFLPALKDYLIREGLIYTVRNYSRPTQTVQVSGVGQCQRAYVGPVYSKSYLEPFVVHSGFPHLDAWWRTICRLIPDDKPMFLYKVTKEVLL